MKWLLGVLSILFWTTALSAHEVQPAIGDIDVADGQLRLALTLNGEALVAGADLDGIQNTDALENSEEIDALRALPPEELSARLLARMPEWVNSLQLRVDDKALTLTPVRIVVEDVANLDLPRTSALAFTADLPDGAEMFSLTWPAGMGAMVLRQQGVEEPYTGYVEGGQSTGPIQIGGGSTPSALETFGSYILVGFDHILPKGLDHILFVLGLFFLSTRFMPLFWQVTSFTLAHTITLALAVLGVVTLPAHIVEPLIAASIVYVAVENILSDKLSKWRPLVVFAFGLLHGLGFASVLGEFGLPNGQIIPALIGFNLGVEIGQLTVIAIAFLLVWYALQVDEGRGAVAPAQGIYGALALIFLGLGFAANTPGFADVMGANAMVFFWPLALVSGLCILSATRVDQLDAYRRFVAIPASAAIAAVGAYWFVERVFF